MECIVILFIGSGKEELGCIWVGLYWNNVRDWIIKIILKGSLFFFL